MNGQAMTMKFMYGGVELPTGSADTNPQAVKEQLAAAFYPELANAEIRGPRVEGDAVVYEFVRAVGTKG